MPSASRVKILLYRSTLDLTTGPGQLIWLQAGALRAAGANLAIACERGRGSFFLGTGVWPQRIVPAVVAAERTRSDRFLVDHSMKIPNADIVFVHNLLTQSDRYLPRDNFVTERMAQEAAVFRDLPASTPIVANSQFVKCALIEHFGIADRRIAVVRPGFRSDRFGPTQAARLRASARRSLALADDTPLIGLVTPGDFRKRGLDVFLESAAEISRILSDARFLVVGGSALPQWARDHRLVTSGKVLYRGADSRPLRWFAALDLFLYPARFEEFGIVVLEALACGIPVLTSRRVGAAECLPDDYAPWLLDTPDAGGFAALAIRLLNDEGARRTLAAAVAASIGALDHRAYARESCIAILAAHRPGET
jgi:glycosyltransferase involved in cell wall biosynthesis